jgi:hypothetical protein
LESIDLSQTQVTTIDNSAFSNCTQLASVSLPASLTSIGSNAFYYCSALTSINLPAGLTTIKSYAFQHTGFTSFTHTSSGPLTIENNAFYDCRQLEDVSLTIGGALTIGESAFGFGYSSVLRSVTIQAGGDVSISGSSNFKTNNGITMESFELHTPGKVILPDFIFYSYQNNALRRCILDARGAGSTIGQYAFEYCRNLEELLLPAGLVSIGRASFSDCNSLTAIELPATTVIADGYQMFYNCSSLESIDLSQLQITALGSYAFSGCSKLASVQLPDGFTTISEGMFNGCSELTTINLPDGLTSIGQNAFQDCSSLNISLTVPATVTTMGEKAFRNCSSLTSATVNANLATLPSYTFAGCSSLRTVNMTGTTTAIGDNAFDGCGQLVDLTLPSTLTSIGQYAFNDCSSLTMLTLPSTLTTFGNGVFDGCSSLLSLEVPEGVTTLPQSLFYGCTGMQSLYLPSTITEINYSAIYYLSNLIDLHIMATTPPPLSSYSRASEVTLFVPEASITAYQAADNWKDFKYIYAELSNLATLDDDEFALLQAIYQKTNGASWTRPWTLGATKAETAIPEGVKVSNGHVVQLALVGNGLSGELPQELMQFPQAWYVNVSRNQLTGDIGAYFDAMTAPNNVLTQLDLSDNQFTGNIGRMNYLTDKLPALTTLKAARNHIRDVKPALPAHITTLDLRGQEVDINNHYLFSNFISTTPENLPNLFPSILTYRHDTYRDYGNTIFLLSAPYADDPWMVQIHKYSNSVSTNRFYYASTESTDGWNFLPSGTIVYLGNGENNLVDRSRIRMEFNYAMGDIDYDGAINVSDLQMLINFAIYPEGYYRYQLFNWAAANLIGADGDDPEVINVQDVVAEINLLLDQYIMPVIPARQQHALRHVQQEEDDEVQATLDVTDGQLVLTTSVPVAAMHLQLAADDARWQTAVGLMSHRQRDGRHVFYSLTGDQLSAGTHVLAEVGSAQLEYAMLAAPDGQPIRCAIRQQEATGISNLPATDADDAERYTLSGMRTKSHAKGVYLVRSAGERMQGKNGKKYIVK